jgi:hypothetical protein
LNPRDQFGHRLSVCRRSPNYYRDPGSEPWVPGVRTCLLKRLVSLKEILRPTRIPARFFGKTHSSRRPPHAGVSTLASKMRISIFFKAKDPVLPPHLPPSANYPGSILAARFPKFLQIPLLHSWISTFLDRFPYS